MRGIALALSPWGLVLSTLLLVGGCCSVPPVRQAISSDGIADVQWEIKRQFGIYDAWRTQHKDDDQEEQKKHAYLCGSGSINFDISSIKVALTTTDETISGPQASGKSTGFVTFKPNLGATKDATNTQELDYTLWPVDNLLPSGGMATVAQADIDHAPLAKALIDLRRGLIKGAQLHTQDSSTSNANVPKVWPPVCFTDYDPDKPSGDSGYQFKLQMQLAYDVKTGFEINVWLIDVSDSYERKTTTGNTITVFFNQTGVKDLQTLANEVTKQCDNDVAFVNRITNGQTPSDPKCSIATRAWHMARHTVAQQGDDVQVINESLKILCKVARAGGKPSEDCTRLTAIAKLAEKYKQADIGVNDVIGLK